MTTSPVPALLQFNGKNVYFTVDTGIVDKVSKRVETSVNASVSGGGTQQFGRTVVANPTRLNVSSSNTTVTELWMRDENKELDHTLRTDLSVRESQKVSVVMAASEHDRVKHYVGIINHNTGTWQSLNSLEHLVHSTVMPKMSGTIYFLMIVGAFSLWLILETWIPTVLALAGIIYLAVNRNNKMSVAKTAFNDHVTEVKQWLNSNN